MSDADLVPNADARAKRGRPPGQPAKVVADVDTVPSTDIQRVRQRRIRTGAPNRGSVRQYVLVNQPEPMVVREINLELHDTRYWEVTEEKGWELAWQVHNSGKAVVKIAPEAECVRVGNILASIGLVVTVVQS